MKGAYPEQPSIGVGVVIIEDNRVLVVQRGKAPGAGTWAFPGGRLELGETLAEAAIREAREETGLVVESGEVIAVVELVDTDEDGRIRFHYVLVDLLAQIAGGTLRPGDDSTAVRWIGIEELGSLPMAPRMVDVIRHVLGERGDSGQSDNTHIIASPRDRSTS